ncbi:MAG TPA: TIGR03557 family F420-dependent LLM class oxidoreductase [Candidatus Binatia bacterium]|nr:TIGR03557 family F420-dependent LLM class oxidoreductase [Candidatus Binatia bacterium]
MLQLGWKAGTEQYPPEELLEYAVAAEQAGFDSIDASDHFHPWAERGQASFVWSWLGAVAARTRRIVLGTGVTCPTLRYHPAIVAQAAATVQRLAPGRFYLGVGTGEALNEYSATGLWPESTVRRERLSEAVELIRRLWTGDKVTHDGTYYATRAAKLYTAPVEPIPILVSTMAPGTAGFAGRLGDGLITVGGDEPDVYREMLAEFERGAREAGKDPSRMPRMIELAVAYAADEKEAIDVRQAYWAGAFVPALFSQRLHTPHLSEQNGKVVGADTIRKKACLSSDPEEHVRFVQRYVELGFDHVIFHSAGPDQGAFIQAYGRDVLPRLRALPHEARSVA